MSSPSRRARPQGHSTVFVLVSTAFVCLATAVASIPFWPVYQSSEFITMVAVTTLAAATVAVLCAVYRAPANIVLLAAIGLYLLLGVPLAVPGRAAFGLLLTADGLRDLAVGTALGWKQLLTITLPVGSFQSLLVPPFLLVLATVTASVSVALRARRAQLAVIGPVLLFLAGIVLGPATEFLPVLTGVLLIATVLLWLVWLRLRRRRESLLGVGAAGGVSRESRVVGIRTAAAAALIVAVASAGAAGATALLPPQAERDVLRTRIVQPFEPRDYPSPLSGFRRYHQQGITDQTMLTVAGLEPGERVRIATLDTYDGVVYAVGSDDAPSESGAFTLVPDRFDQSGVAGRRVDVEVTVGAYRGVYLPTVGKLEDVAFRPGSEAASSFYYNDVTGTAAVLDGVGAGDSYRLVGVEPEQPSVDEIASLIPGDAPVPPLELVPDGLAGALDRYIAEDAGPGEQLAAAIEGLRTEGYISHGVGEEEPSRSGHSADRITELVSEPRMIGDGEQYAVTAAMMARDIGFPARVVMGFLPDAEATGAETVLRGSDIAAWIEVDTTRFGWVTIDPTPPVREIPEEVPEEPTQVARPQSPVQPPTEEPDTPDEQQPPETLQDEPEEIDPLLALLLGALQVAGWALLAVAVILSPFLAIIGAKLRRRRRRRRAPTPVARVTGGWAEFEDAVVDHGFSPPVASTRSEFAGMVGGAQPLVLAAEADRAVFAPDGPRDDDADNVWRSVDELRHALDARLSRWRRLRAWISLRSFRNARGRPPRPS